jgi:integrase
MRHINEPRLYGPYQHGELWRIHIVTRCGSGRKTTYQAFATRALAEAFLAGARDEAQGVTVKAAVEMFIAKNRVKGNTAGTIAVYEHRLNAILNLPTNDNRPIRWLVGRGDELYQASKQRKSGKARANDTHIGGLSTGKRFGAFCLKQKLLKVNPFDEVEPDGRLRRGASKARLGVDEARALRAWCHQVGGIDAVLTLGYLLLGSRCSELTDRYVHDVDDGGRLLWLNRTKTEAGERRLIVPDELRPMLLELAKGRAPDERLFLNQSGKPMTRRVSYQRITKITGKVIGRVLGPQSLRRSQSTFATDAGATGPMVSAHLGHVVHQEMSAITKRSYVDANSVRDAMIERGFHVLDGGKAAG